MRRDEYLKLETTGVVKSVQPAIFGQRENDSSIYTSPYSVFTPMQYLSIAYNPREYRAGASIDKILEKNGKQSLSMLINAYLYRDRLSGLPLTTTYINFSGAVGTFSRFSYLGGKIYRSRTIDWIGGYSLFSNVRGRLIPNILAVTLPENIIYHKLRILTNKDVDMSKVIILIDNQLHRHRNVMLKNLYNDQLKQAILKTSASVWEVPLDFIINSCFSGRYEQTGSIKQRKNEEEKLITKFLNQ
jgi:hypothetical protein